jgi:hypothetical protein
MLADSITGTDTVWAEYTKTSFQNCAFSLVPSIITEPIMSAKTIASWADSTTIITRDTLDTCIIEVIKNGDYYFYMVDMQRGLIISFTLSSIVGSATQQYLYGYDTGIYFLRRVCFFDTTIENGGYDFYNIRVNDNPVSHVVNIPRSPKRPFVFNAFGKNGAIDLLGKENVRMTLYDLLGRRLFSRYFGKDAGIVKLGDLCPAAQCPSGRLILRVEIPGSGMYNAVISR